MSSRPTRPQPDVLLADLQSRLRQLEGVRRPSDQSRISSGHLPLDQLLPEGGFRPGTLVEWLVEQSGAGASTLALRTARECCRDGRALVIIDRAGEFYPPGAVCLGIDLEQTIIVRPRSPPDESWAMDQTLRCTGVAAVLAWPERCGQRAIRRWQLAAEQSGSLGLLVRPVQARDEPCWAAVRLLVTTVPVVLPAETTASSAGRRLRVELVRGCGVIAGKATEWELNDETGALPVASAPRAASRARRA
jgi:protein ImuA